jgi:hypothetical protein
MYCEMMKTTLELDPELLKRAKQKALDSGTTFKSVVEEALQLYLGNSTKVPVPLVTVVYGGAAQTTDQFATPSAIPSGEPDLNQDDYWQKRFGFTPK